MWQPACPPTSLLRSQQSAPALLLPLSGITAKSGVCHHLQWLIAGHNSAPFRCTFSFVVNSIVCSSSTCRRLSAGDRVSYDFYCLRERTPFIHCLHRTGCSCCFADNSAIAENSAAFSIVSISFSIAYAWPSHCSLSVRSKVAAIKDDIKD